MTALLGRLLLSRRDRRALSLGVPLLLAGLFWRAAVGPYLHEVREVRERLVAERALLARERGLLAAAEGAAADLKVLSDQLIAVAPRLIGGPNTQAATAGLAMFLETGARQRRVWLPRVEPGAPEPAGVGLVALPIRLRGESDLEGILTLLHGIENSSKLLRVSSLTIKSTRPGQLVAREEAEVLEFEALVRGYSLAAAPAPTTEAVAR